MTRRTAMRLLCLILLSANTVVAQSRQPTRKNIPEIAKAAKEAIVTIVMANDDKPIALGTGFLVRQDGVIVTNYHVIATGNVAVVKFADGTISPVDGVLAAEKVRDLAVIKIHGRTFPTLKLGNSEQIQVGEEVVAIGNPLGLELTVSNGILSAVRTAENGGGEFLQITAPISHGSSGGPLFNMTGQVIGVTSMYFEGGENLNFAIPINDAKALLQKQSANLQPLPNEVPRNVTSKATPRENPQTAPRETPKESHVEAAPSQEHACWEQAAKVTINKKTSYFPDEPRIEFKNYYDPQSAKCYVESGFYWDNGKKYPPNKTSTGLVTIENAFSEGEIYAYILLGSNSTILGCQVSLPQVSSSPQYCNSKEQFAELVFRNFRILPPTPPNTKVSASLPYPNSASEVQIVEDLKYCHENPNNSLQMVGSTSVISCKDATAVIEKERFKPCQSGKQSKVMKKMCKDLLDAAKEYRAR